MKESMHIEPTYENQLWHARRLLREKGIHALYNPHAATGKTCGCGSCFCCAAFEVYKEAQAHIQGKVNAMLDDKEAA